MPGFRPAVPTPSSSGAWESNQFSFLSFSRWEKAGIWILSHNIMKKYNFLFLLAVLLPLMLFVFPLWKITLTAPQYPDGVSMYIWINKITGDTESTLQNINILNHYVGMKYIVPDSIPELKYFPWVVGGMSLLGLIFFMLRKKPLYLTWVVIFVILGGLGIYDFYLWEYDYGHNLDPKAPIKVPGMAYQPPVIGSKMLLNFKADSWPALGGVFLGLGILLGFVAFYLENRKQLKPAAKTIGKAVAAVFLLVSATACSPSPRPLAFGDDHCEHCKMKIVQPQYGAELVTTTGKVYTFDAIECLIQFKQDGQWDERKIAYEMVVPFDKPAELVDAASCIFIRSEALPSPMGMYLTAVSSESKIDDVIKSYEGEKYDWSTLQQKADQLQDLTAQIQ